MINRIADLAQQIQIEQRKPRDEAETDGESEARENIEDEWIGSLYYKGNSNSWTHSKAARYKDDLSRAWDALAALGIYPDGQTHIADVIRGLKISAPARS